MDPQKRFLASTLQGAIDAEVTTYDDLYRHISAHSLAEHVPADILWAVITEGMRRAGLGFAEGGSGGASAMPAIPVVDGGGRSSNASNAEASVANGDGVEEAFDEAQDDGAREEDALPFEVNDDEMPPIPDDDAVVVEDVDWDDDDEGDDE